MDLSARLQPLAAMLTILSFCETPMGDPRTTVAGQFCNNTLAVSGTVLAINFVPAMGNLSTVVDQNGFGTAVVGESPNAVFGLGQCFKDLDSVDCRLCFSEIRSQLPKCYPDTGGMIFLDGCFGRYENYSFFDEVLGSKDTTVCSSSKNSSNPKDFDAVVKEVIGNVSSEARINKGFAAWSASNSGLTVYALAQCWENLNRTLCSTCLDAAASSIVSCSPAIEGRSLFAGCYMRYSTELFWNVNPTTSGSSGKGDILWIILGSAIGVLLLIAGILFWKRRHFWSKPNGNSLIDLYGPVFSAAISQSNLNFKYDDLKKATNNFSLSNKLGQGSYGTVYKAVLSDGKEIAVKRLFMNTRQWVSQFFNEVDLISRVRHKNLVKLLGCSVDGPESLLLYEYYYNRSLDLFIFDANHDNHLNWQQRFDIIKGIAEGLSYLHEECETRIIHRDIKASNILLDEKFKPKVTDFGLARSFSEDQSHLSTGIAGTLGYMAPEYVVHGHLTEKADVYSFGILILEIMAGKRCSSAIGSHAGHYLLAKIWNHYKANTVAMIIDEHLYEESMKDKILHVVEVGLSCTQADPHHRPTMSKVVEILRSSKNEQVLILTDPPFLDVTMEEAEVSRLLSDSSPGLTRSPDSWEMN